MTPTTQVFEASTLYGLATLVWVSVVRRRRRGGWGGCWRTRTLAFFPWVEVWEY